LRSISSPSVVLNVAPVSTSASSFITPSFAINSNTAMLCPFSWLLLHQKVYLYITQYFNPNSLLTSLWAYSVFHL
jgi:hypothetical protein